MKNINIIINKDDVFNANRETVWDTYILFGIIKVKLICHIIKFS